MTADQIEAAHQAAMAAALAAADQWQTTHKRGYDASVRLEITAIRRTVAQSPAARTAPRLPTGSPAAPQLHPQTRVELDDAGLEAG